MRLSRISLGLLLAACSAGDADRRATDVSAVGTADGLDAGLELAAPIPDDAEFHPSRVVVGFRSGRQPPELDQLGGQLAGRRLLRVRTLDRPIAAVYELPGGVSVRDAVAELRSSGRFRFAEPDYVRHASGAVDDIYRPLQWNLDAVAAEAAWDYSTGIGEVVAVVDTGVTSGPLDGLGFVLGGWDYVNDDDDPSDDHGHGTHVAGTINQATNNKSGVAGLAYGAEIMPLKVLDSTGTGYTSDIALGILYAADHGADVINLSLGSSSYSFLEAYAVNYAWSSGVFVAAAAGNSGGSTVDYPAAYSGAVAVGATDYLNNRTSYSSGGSALDLMAPGGDTKVDRNGDGYPDGVVQETFRASWGYYYFQGTSMATPHVAASAALLMSLGATNEDAEAYLEATALDLAAPGHDTQTGYGLIQPAAALEAWIADTTVNVPPVADAGGPYEGIVDTAIDFDGRGSTDEDGSVVSYDWDFGDGDAGTGAQPSHAYAEVGTYLVTLTVTDDAGDSASATALVNVDPEPCVVTIDDVRFLRKRGWLITWAYADDTSAVLYVYADGTYLGSMTYKPWIDYWKIIWKVAVKPATVTIDSDCGGSDSWDL